MADPITITALLTYLGGVTAFDVVKNVGKTVLLGQANKGICSIFKKCYDKAKPLWKKDELPKNAHLLRAVNTAHLNATAYFIKAVAKELEDRGEVQYASNLKLSFADWAKHEKDIIEHALDAEIEHDNPIYKDIEKLLAASSNPTVKELRKELAEICKRDLLKKLPEQIGASASAKGLVGFTLPDFFETMLRNGWDEGGKTIDWFDVLTLEFATILKDEDGKNPTVKEAFKDRLLSDIKVDTTDIKVDTTQIIGILEQQVASIAEIKKELVAVKQWLEGIGVKIDAVKEDTEEIKKTTADTNERLKRLEALLLEREGKQSEEVKHALYTSEEVKELIEKLIKLEQEGKNYAAIEEVKKELEQIRDNVERLSETFKNIDLAKASERLKKANALFKEGDFKEVRKLLEEEERVQERARILEEHKTIEQQRKNLADEDLVHAQSILLDTDDPNRFEEAEKAFQSSLDIYPNYNNHFEYAYFLANQNQHHKAIQQYKYALTYAGNDKSKKADILNNLGKLYRTNNLFKEARQAYDEALAIYRKLAVENPAAYVPDVAGTLNNLGNLYSANNTSQAAAQVYNEALAIYRRLAAANPAAYEPAVATTLNNLGALYSDNKDSAAAEQAYNEALEIYRRLAAENPAAYEPDVAMTLNNLGALYSANNALQAAGQTYDKALEIRRRLAEDNPAAYEPAVATTLNNLGALYRANNASAAAAQAYDEALEIRRRLAAANPAAYEPAVASTLSNLGNLYADVDIARSRPSYEAAATIYRRLAAENPDAFLPELARTIAPFGIGLKTAGQHEEAKKYLEEALGIYKQFATRNAARYQPFVDIIEEHLKDL